ncbi:hypothetical protein ABW20_dc0100773 [Dactylellina cionopaga]|nr:hypothetical protein ABW20_dc0100773 [Dactylellina cionopaga]
MLPPERVVAHLSTITTLITSATPETSLHNHIGVCLDPLYSSSSSSSSSLLEDATAQVAAGGRHSAEISSLLHKFKTRISSLLQSRTSQARWAGVCLVKAGIETSPTFLQGVGAWIPMLLKMVSRSEPGSPITERAIAVLTRIFVLTTSKPTLTRELTSPHLPTFSQYLVSPALATGDNLLVVLQSISQILKTHPTTFRPQQQKTLELVRSILFSEDDKSHPNELLHAATVVYVALVKCAQPKTQGEEWVKLFKETVTAAEQTCDILFETLIEEKDNDKPSSQRRHSDNANHLLSPERVGVKRICTLITVLQTLLSQPTGFTPNPSIPLSPLISLLDRLFSVHPNTKPHPSFPPSTYHLLLAAYPVVLQHTIQLTATIVSRTSNYCPSLALQFLHPIAFTFKTAKYHILLRTQTYTALSHFLSLIGRTLSSKDTQPLLEIISTACEDIVPPPPPVIITKDPVSTPGSMLLTQPTSSGSTSTYKKRKAPAPQNKSNTPAASSVHADQFLKPSNSSSLASGMSEEDTPLVREAKKLLTTVLLNVPSTSIPSEIRSKIERTMVLAGYSLGLLAAVLYPASKKRGGSLLPHLIAIHSADIRTGATDDGNVDTMLLHMAIEGTVHPRMQVVKNSTNGLDDRGSVLGSPIESRLLVGSPRAVMLEHVPATVSLDEVVGAVVVPPEGDVTMAGVVADEEYPEPPPAPVPQHAKLPASPKGKAAALPPAPQPSQSTASQPPQPGAMSPPAGLPVSLPRNGSSNGMNGSSGDRNMFMPMPSPGRGVHAALPPSPLRQSMSIFEAEDEREEKGRGLKRLKVDDARSPLGMGVVYNRSSSPDIGLGGEEDAEGSDDDDAEIPEIVMGDSDDD